ncbi:zinc finger CCHC domain-containing protein 9-like isoform X2 [Melospiza georgiana]|uniref:zinc finger CCHC domain-containing protein 9-like isoform X2 n=1 Tax=Melospiza georgiana TaxID=44398 RepID=UPI0025ACE803|nr:zinc finger CCHC domain-containing protein 9-like isoform X2 [Melospiza georgiana]
MTRWARRSAPPGARALSATPWEQLAPGAQPEPPPPARRRRRKEYENQDVNGFAAHRGEQQQQQQEEEEEARRKDRRRESRRLRRQERKKNAMVCFHCREPGHGVADCPAVLESQDMGTGICYRCGSTEHDLSQCRAKVDPAAGPFPYAKCFICGEMGHLSRSCPDNPKGLYAEGGGCRLCGSVEHFKKDCPEKQNADWIWAKGIKVAYCAPTNSDEEELRPFTDPPIKPYSWNSRRLRLLLSLPSVGALSQGKSYLAVLG